MNIVIDTQALIHQRTGIGVYAKGLIQHLDRKRHCYYFLSPARKQDLRVPSRLLWESFYLPRQAKKLKADLIHTVGFSAPIIRSCKTIATVHDLIGMIYPQNLGRLSRFYWSWWLPYSFKKVDHIIASSQNTKQDLMRLIRYPESKISVIPLAADPRFKKMDQRQAQLNIQKYIGVKQYLLYVGTLEPRKNLKNLILAYAQLPAEIRERYALVLVGKAGWGTAALKQLIRERELETRIIFTGYISDEALVYFYNAATLFVYPSLYEGFGLPVLEALSCGAPVIASGVSSIPEITGDAAVLRDPSDISGWTSEIQNLLVNDTLRQQTAARGLIRAKTFCWSRVADETTRIYEQVAG